MFVDLKLAQEITKKYGTPVYVYSEKELRAHCREMLEAFDGMLIPSYSIKANTNIHLMKIIREEGFYCDAMSPGEIFLAEKAGFTDAEIYCITNNVSAEEMKFAIDRNVLLSVDSLSQLETYGKINPGGRISIRVNPGYGMGAGHDKKVITAGHETKFGVQAELFDQVAPVLDRYKLRLVGVQQHIGSLFLDPIPYIDAAKALLELVKRCFPGLEFVDFGGGFGCPYKPGEPRLDFKEFMKQFRPILEEFREGYDNKKVEFNCEPGRYVVAESSVILGRVHSIKDNYGSKYVGTDIGFNVLQRPVMYDSYHHITVLGGGDVSLKPADGSVNVVGNICESGDVLAHDRNIGPVREGDLIAVENAGAYGFCMSSNYNCRLKPAEVLIKEDGTLQCIRRADTFEDLMRNF